VRKPMYPSALSEGPTTSHSTADRNSDTFSGVCRQDTGKSAQLVWTGGLTRPSTGSAPLLTAAISAASAGAEALLAPD
jgi:hypothetical protein